MKFISDKIPFTPAMKTFVEETIEKKLSRVIPEPRSVEVKLTKLNNDDFKVDLSINKFRAQATCIDFYAAFAKATNTLKKIIIKNNKKQKDKEEKEHLDIFDFGVEDTEPIKPISKEKIFDLVPITIEEAIDELEHTDYVFYVFRNKDDNNNVSIIYRRHSDEYGLIKCR